ncbi:hypothetical protein [Pseudofulvimonas gallinarii]|uniref:Uncharacterized protein n=1 Tax=Pseudofulvimonas gallinarii TaxID=634155 RepID=A0A4R3LJE7_9GAMM|nr:hypothetical protein [Pseudofulvimonas gallinarii]TCT00382.1 hypothetical protein EDC25_103150 [Pseudofulvimonas gallinarii]
MNMKTSLLAVVGVCASIGGVCPSFAVEADLYDRLHGGFSGLQVELTSRDQFGAVSYRRFDDGLFVLSARSRGAVLCAADSGSAIGPRLVVDPNGPRGQYSGVPLGNFYYSEWMDSGRAPLSYGVEQLLFVGANYNIDPTDQTYRLGVNSVQGFCVAGLEQVPPPSEEPTCIVHSHDGVHDVVHRGSFEAGELKVTTALVASDPPSGVMPGLLRYRHTLSAQGGAVDGIRFREQFPHYFGSPSDFRDALALDSYWTCQPGGAVDGGVGRGYCSVISGRGYISADNLALEDQGCVVLEVTREWTHAAEKSPESFSGTIHSAAFHSGESSGNGLPGVERSLLRFVPESP